ncbi:MAG: hypothetical protein WA040_23960 [Anaerolineae bacterium]
MSRNDLSDYLIHFTKGDSLEAAFVCLRKIMAERRLLGSNSLIKGGYSCVCFSEAPLTALQNGLMNPQFYSQYSPFGVLVHKYWLFQQGGRPVIYQPDDEFSVLPESHRWRHVRYEPPKIDFSWEREWRIPCVSLSFDQSTASIVVPNTEWAQYMVQLHEQEQEYQVMQLRTIFDDTLAQQHCSSFQWRLIPLQSGIH